MALLNHINKGTRTKELALLHTWLVQLNHPILLPHLYLCWQSDNAGVSRGHRKPKQSQVLHPFWKSKL